MFTLFGDVERSWVFYRRENAAFSYVLLFANSVFYW